MCTSGCAEHGRTAQAGHGSRPVLTALTVFASKVDGLCHPHFTRSDHSQEAGGEARVSYVEQISVDSQG